MIIRHNRELRKSTLLRPPKFTVGNTKCGIINETGYQLLNGDGLIAIVKGDDGSISWKRVDVPEGTISVVQMRKPILGGIRLYHGNCLEKGKYVCKWDDINERLVIVEGKKESSSV